MAAAILSFVGLLAGAVLQFFFTKHNERKKYERDLRAKAYSDYLLCVSEQANLAHQRQSAEGRQLGARTADAKCRISLYGAESVVAAFARFERLGATMNTEEQRQAFTQMVIEMRRDAIGTSSASPADVEAVLLGHAATKRQA